MSVYNNDPRVDIGLYNATVAGPSGLSWVYAAAGPDDWVVAPISARNVLETAAGRDDLDTIRAIRESNPHFTDFDEAIRSLPETRSDGHAECSDRVEGARYARDRTSMAGTGRRRAPVRAVHGVRA